VEQNVRQALELADKSYVLETGRMILKGEVRKLLKNEYI
jgi:ABC-type branched-subunit amino acid transport system ATPase component